MIKMVLIEYQSKLSEYKQVSIREDTDYGLGEVEKREGELHKGVGERITDY